MATSSQPVAADPTTLRGRALAVALLVAGALFMENLDATIIATGLPTMARDFHVTAVALNVGITAYLLTLAIFIPVSGWMANRFGERKVFASAIALFTAASVVCGLSHSLPAFTAARVLQGLGGSMMVPVGRLMVVRTVSKAQLMKAIAYTIWPALVAPILGPPVGGWILSFARWPWLFLLNVPVGIVLFALAWWLVRDTERDAPPPLDVVGFLLAGGACFCLMLSLEVAEEARPHVSLAIGGLAACGLLVWGCVRHLRRSTAPLFQLAVFRVETFRTVVGAGSLFRMAVFSVPFLLPLLFQTAFGLDALASGSLTMAVFAGNLAMKPLTTPLLRRYGFRTVLLVNGVATVVLLAACGFLRVDTPKTLVLLVLFLGGLGRSMELTSLTTIGFADLPPELTVSGTTLATMVQQMTTSLGIAFAALVLHLSTARHPGPPAELDFRVAYCTMAVLALVSLPAFARLHPDAGAAVSGATLRMNRQEPAEG